MKKKSPKNALYAVEMKLNLLKKLDGKNLFTIKSATTRQRTLTSDVFKSLTGEI